MSLLSFSALAELNIDNGYLRKPIPGRNMSAAFMSINNNGPEDIVLTTVSIEGARDVEIHTHSHIDGMMRMRQLHELNIKAGESILLEPGAMHLMVFGIKKLTANPKITLCDNKNICYSSVLDIRSLIK